MDLSYKYVLRSVVSFAKRPPLQALWYLYKTLTQPVENTILHHDAILQRESGPAGTAGTACPRDQSARTAPGLLRLRQLGVTSIVREAENAGVPGLPGIVDKARVILESGLGWAYTDGGFDFLPSYAHALEEPIVKESP